MLNRISSSKFKLTNITIMYKFIKEYINLQKRPWRLNVKVLNMFIHNKSHHYLLLNKKESPYNYYLYKKIFLIAATNNFCLLKK